MSADSIAGPACILPHPNHKDRFVVDIAPGCFTSVFRVSTLYPASLNCVCVWECDVGVAEHVTSFFNHSTDWVPAIDPRNKKNQGANFFILKEKVHLRFFQTAIVSA